jgi:hypothetical protein
LKASKPGEAVDETLRHEVRRKFHSPGLLQEEGHAAFCATANLSARSNSGMNRLHENAQKKGKTKSGRASDPDRIAIARGEQLLMDILSIQCGIMIRTRC